MRPAAVAGTLLRKYSSTHFVRVVTLPMVLNSEHL